MRLGMLLVAATGLVSRRDERADTGPTVPGDPPLTQLREPDQDEDEELRRLTRALTASRAQREAARARREAWRIEWLRRRPSLNVRSDGHDEARLTAAEVKRERRRQRRLRERA